MADTTQKAKATSKPRKTATKKDKVAEPAKAATASRQEDGLVAKAETVKTVKASAKPNTNATSIHKVADLAKAQRPSREEIERAAYDFWAKRGYQHGYALQDWLRAERELLRAKQDLLQMAS
jgi:hypothetical protein